MIFSRIVVLFLLQALSLLNVEATPSRLQWNLKDNARIIGGQEVDDKIVPFMASIMVDGHHYCGGFIINARTILTAAHCLDKNNQNDMTIHVGDNRIYSNSSRIYGIKAVHWHPGFERPKPDNDIGFVRLNTVMLFNERVQPIALIDANTVLLDGSYATVYGWGRTADGAPEVLNFANGRLVDHETCKRLLKNNKIPAHMLCADDPAGSGVACKGDSGGPLVQNAHAIGIVAWGPCSTVGGFTNLQYFLSWVSETLLSKYGEQI